VIQALVVTVLIDGSLVATSMPATLVSGTIAAPVDPFLQLIARRISVDVEHGRVTFERDGRCLTEALGSRAALTGRSSRSLPIAPYLRDGRVIIPLAATARALGATVTYDARARRVEIQLPPAVPLSSASPVRDWTPPPALPVRPTPRPVPSTQGAPTAIPQPRRTPILLNAYD